MKIYKFTLILSGVSEISSEVSNALHQATNGDIEFQMREGIASLDFERDAPSLQDALITAIEEVEAAGVGVRVIRVESEDANTIAKINAELIGETSSQ